jgi:hypothetical protein
MGASTGAAGLPLVVAVRLRRVCAAVCAPADASRAQVDCLAEHAAALRGVLGAGAALAGTGTGWGAAGVPPEVLSSAAVVLARSLHELSPGALSHMRGAAAVVLLSPWEGATEEALAAELGVGRVLRATPPADEERADTVLALLLSLLRRTHALSRAVARGAWLPPPAAYRGARRCAGLHLGLVGLDGCVCASCRARACVACGSLTRAV